MLTTTATATTTRAASIVEAAGSTSTATRKTTSTMTSKDMTSCNSTEAPAARTNAVDTTTTAAVAATATATATAAGIATVRTTRIAKTTTTITSDPGILCFHHCNVKVFCFTLPHICPQCKAPLTTHANSDASSAGGIGGGGSNRGKNRSSNNKHTMRLNKTDTNNKNNSNNNVEQSLALASNKHDNDVGTAATCDSDPHSAPDDDGGDDENDLNGNWFASNILASRLLPFRLPYPFVRANQYPCAIVLRPTTGDFLNDYNNTTDLHIAVTTSSGCVVEFDRHGLRRHRTVNMSEWWQCLLVGDVPEPWYDYWDQVLYEICQQPDKWTVSHYHEDKHNCYTFVLTFLQALTYDKLSEAATSKTRFCEKYIVPRTTTAGKYISLYRKLRDAGVYVHHTNQHKVRYVKQEKQQQPLQQSSPNKSNNLTTTTMTKNSLVANKQQRQLKQQQQQQSQNQHLSNHHSHHSIISRPHSSLCTIEE